ncbi:MAG: porin [Betaproteobacteria bacterium]|nr:porin [Betaproteobacteria bacterium]
MRRKRLSAILASAYALSGTALAQSDEDVPSRFEVYGRINVTYERFSGTGLPTTGNVFDTGSRIGFRGRRDLGSRLAAFFQLESRTRVDDGTSEWASRGSFVGLQTPFGTGRLGRTVGPVYRATYEYIGVFNGNGGTSADAFTPGTVTGFQSFMNNTAWYTSPSFGAVKLEAAYSRLGETPLPGMSQPRHVGVVAVYDTPTLHLAASRAETRNTTNLGDGTPNLDIAYTIGGLYTMKALVVGALYDRATSKLLVDEAKRTHVRFVAMVPAGPHEFHLDVGRVNHRLDAKLSDDGASQRTLGYAYNFDPRTRIYGFYTVVDNDNNGNYGFRTHLPGVDNKSTAVGMRYIF